MIYSRLRPFGLVAEYIFGSSFRRKYSRTYIAWKTDTAVKEGEEDGREELQQDDPRTERSGDRIQLETMIREMRIRIRDVEDVLKEHYLDMTLFEVKDDEDITWYKKIVQGGRTLFKRSVFCSRRQKLTTTQEDTPA